MALVFCTNTQNLTVEVGNERPDAKIVTFIGSVGMPKAGIKEKDLPKDGTVQHFLDTTRFRTTPAGKHYVCTVESSLNSFTVVRFRKSDALVMVMNNDRDHEFVAVGVGQAGTRFSVVASPGSSLKEYIDGESASGTYAWINALPVLEESADSPSIELKPAPKPSLTRAADDGVPNRQENVGVR